MMAHPCGRGLSCLLGFAALLYCAMPALAAKDNEQLAPLPKAPITTEAHTTPKSGWMDNGHGRLHFTYTNHGSHPAKLLQWEGDWRATADGPVLFHWTWDPKHETIQPGKTLKMGLTAWMPPKVAKAVGERPALLNGASIFEINGQKMVAPYHTSAKVAHLTEPLKKVVLDNVGLELQQSRFASFTSLHKVLVFMNEAYKLQNELTGYVPYHGKPIIYREVPNNPSWAYAGDPISINTLFVDSTIKDWNKGVVSFGWIHEMGHDHDFGGWYIWNSSTSESQANLKLLYVYEKLLTAKSHFVCRSWAKWDRGKNYLITGRQFVEQMESTRSDRYLGNPKRTWENGGQMNALYIELVRRYGWGVMKKWYRTYGALGKTKLPKPKTPEEKINLSCAILCTITGDDLVPKFQLWRFPVTEDKIKAIEAKYDLAKMVPPGPMDRFGKIAPHAVRPYK